MTQLIRILFLSIGMHKVDLLDLVKEKKNLKAAPSLNVPHVMAVVARISETLVHIFDL